MLTIFVHHRLSVVRFFSLGFSSKQQRGKNFYKHLVDFYLDDIVVVIPINCNIFY